MINSTVTDIEGTRIVKYDEGSYVIKPFKGRDSAKILAKLTKYGSKSFGGILRGVATSEDEVDVVSLAVAASLQDAFIDIDDPVFIHFITDEILSNVTKDNVPFDFDKEFVGKGIVRTFDLIKNVISYNYAPVFQELGINLTPKE